MYKGKIGIIGMGNMGSAIGMALVNSGYELVISNRSRDKLEPFGEFDNVTVAENNAQVAEEAEVIFLGVKPHMYRNLAEELKYIVNKDQIIISIAVGLTIDTLETLFGKKKIVRTMPNTGALIGESMTAMCPNSKITDTDMRYVKEIISSFGKAAVVEENLMDAFSGAVGCMPAFVYMFIEAAADGAVLNGLKREEAYEYIAQSVLGAAKMILETKYHPGVLKDMVTSPGGSTIVGVKSLEDLGLRRAVLNAVDLSIEKNRKMGK